MQIFNIFGPLKAQLKDFFNYVPCHLAKRTATNYFFLLFPTQSPFLGNFWGLSSHTWRKTQTKGITSF